MKRTTHRSTANTKLYAVRTKTGRFADVQTHKRASAADQRKRSNAEHSWVRYAVYVKSGVDAGLVLGIYNSRAVAADVRKYQDTFTVKRKWSWVKVEIHAGCPDPLRRRR